MKNHRSTESFRLRAKEARRTTLASAVAQTYTDQRTTFWFLGEEDVNMEDGERLTIEGTSIHASNDPKTRTTDFRFDIAMSKIATVNELRRKHASNTVGIEVGTNVLGIFPVTDLKGEEGLTLTVRW